MRAMSAIMAVLLSGCVTVYGKPPDAGGGKAPNFAVGDTLANEIVLQACFIVKKSGKESGKPSTLQFYTTDGTARQPGDYAPVNVMLNFAAAELQKSVCVPLVNDGLAEPNETFTVNIVTVDNAKVTDGQGIGTIEDTTPPPGPPPTFTCQDVTVTEGVAYAQIICDKTGGNGQPSLVHYMTGGGMPTATEGADYTPVSGQLTVAADQTRFSFNVPIIDDSLVEPVESFGTQITVADNGTVGHNAMVLLGDNDSPPPPPDRLVDGGYAKALSACEPVDPQYDAGEHGVHGSRWPVAGEVFVLIPGGSGYAMRPPDLNTLHKEWAVQPLTTETRALYLWQDCLAPVAAP